MSKTWQTEEKKGLMQRHRAHRENRSQTERTHSQHLRVGHPAEVGAVEEGGEFANQIENGDVLDTPAVRV